MKFNKQKSNKTQISKNIGNSHNNWMEKKTVSPIYSEFQSKHRSFKLHGSILLITGLTKA